jgi:hypothetical protein
VHGSKELIAREPRQGGESIYRHVADRIPQLRAKPLVVGSRVLICVKPRECTKHLLGLNRQRRFLARCERIDIPRHEIQCR